QLPVLITYQSPCLDTRRIKLNLNFHVGSNREQSASHLTNQYLARLSKVVYVGVITISLICKNLHLCILQVAHPEAKHSEIDPCLALFGYQPLHRLVTRLPYIEVSVGSQNNTIVPIGIEVLLCQRIGES